ncbi:hypothetical protein M427DRAFT_48505 [Gonapodya prolifera JEL478]|uniref:Homing endonuclease n=1 Tax=Gonapodya prolifera (strain JEL478) TaxID=1344416 RepID=A0A139A116_GONPJ|nr:hypothetical protein M427DRAFT_48505 [Gonapodya prolifera JEL478]|eukprot:KXS10215.1 hypothetical protein M427DRAFT_48505 [Gonapodya prolifera JEL478]
MDSDAELTEGSDSMDTENVLGDAETSDNDSLHADDCDSSDTHQKGTQREKENAEREYLNREIKGLMSIFLEKDRSVYQIKPSLKPFPTRYNTERMTESWLSGFFDGDGHISFGRNGRFWKLQVGMTQSNYSFLAALQSKYGGGSLHKGKKATSSNGVQGWELVYGGTSAYSILKILAENAVIKSKQAGIALQFLDSQNFARREELAGLMKYCNSNKMTYASEVDLTRMNPGFLAGIFDAEGSTNRLKHEFPTILTGIKEYLGCGKDNRGAFTITKYEDYVALYKSMHPFVIIKSVQLRSVLKSYIPNGCSGSPSYTICDCPIFQNPDSDSTAI